jgi:hypothetical protein
VEAFSDERTGLSQGTRYFYRGYAVNAVGTGYSPQRQLPYRAGAGGDVTFANVTATGLRVSWTAGADSDGAIVVVRAGNSTVDDPADGTVHAANAAYGTEALGDSYVVYRGDATQVDVSGLTAGTTYYVEVFAYKGTAANSGVDQGINYRQSSPATGDRSTLAAEPDTHASNLSFTDVGRLPDDRQLDQRQRREPDRRGPGGKRGELVTHGRRGALRHGQHQLLQRGRRRTATATRSATAARAAASR